MNKGINNSKSVLKENVVMGKEYGVGAMLTMVKTGEKIQVNLKKEAHQNG